MVQSFYRIAVPKGIHIFLGLNHYTVAHLFLATNHCIAVHCNRLTFLGWLVRKLVGLIFQTIHTTYVSENGLFDQPLIVRFYLCIIVHRFLLWYD